jgi:hypothetical protein
MTNLGMGDASFLSSYGKEFDYQILASHTHNDLKMPDGMEIWRALRGSHIPTPPGAATDRGLARRHTNTLPGAKDRSDHEQTSLIDLFTGAGDVVVPIYERALGVIAPGPDVKLEE